MGLLENLSKKEVVLVWKNCTSLDNFICLAYYKINVINSYYSCNARQGNPSRIQYTFGSAFLALFSILEADMRSELYLSNRGKSLAIHGLFSFRSRKNSGERITDVY